MGGFFRAVTRIFKQPPQVAQQPTFVAATPVSQTKSDKSRQTLASSGYGSSSILTSQQGIEEEANVSKTVLGGTTIKKKKYKV
jgi:hypothetical protein